MWKALVSAVVLALADRTQEDPPEEEESTQTHQAARLLGTATGQSLRDKTYATPEERERFRAGFSAQLRGDEGPLDDKTLKHLEHQRDELRQRRAKELEREYLAAAAREPGVVHQEPGLFWRALEPGTGDKPDPLDTVDVEYTATSLPGTPPLSWERSIRHPVGQLPKCLRAAVLETRVGGRARVVCPAEFSTDITGGEGQPSRPVVLEFVLRGVTVHPSRLVTAWAPDPSAKYYQLDIPPGAPVLGPDDAPLTFVVWCDFGNSCRREMKSLLKTQRNAPRDVRLVMRFMLADDRRWVTRMAAEAALAAHDQGRFWDYFERLAEGLHDTRDIWFHGSWSAEQEWHVRSAQALGLDMDRFERSLSMRRGRTPLGLERVASEGVGYTRDYYSGDESPRIFVNCRELYSADEAPERFTWVLTHEKIRAERLLASGVAANELHARLCAQGQPPYPIQAPPPPPPPPLLDLSHSPSLGPDTAPVTVVAFMSFDESDQAEVAANLRLLAEQYKNQVRIAFKHGPLTTRLSGPAALASLAAQAQGRFWDYHDRLYNHQPLRDEPSLLTHARALGLDMGRFQKDMSSGTFASWLEADKKELRWFMYEDSRDEKSVVFVDQRRVLNPRSMSELHRRVREALDRRGASGR